MVVYKAGFGILNHRARHFEQIAKATQNRVLILDGKNTLSIVLVAINEALIDGRGGREFAAEMPEIEDVAEISGNLVITHSELIVASLVTNNFLIVVGVVLRSEIQFFLLDTLLGEIFELVKKVVIAGAAKP